MTPIFIAVLVPIVAFIVFVSIHQRKAICKDIYTIKKRIEGVKKRFSEKGLVK